MMKTSFSALVYRVAKGDYGAAEVGVLIERLCGVQLSDEASRDLLALLLNILRDEEKQAKKR